MRHAIPVSILCKSIVGERSAVEFNAELAAAFADRRAANSIARSLIRSPRALPFYLSLQRPRDVITPIVMSFCALLLTVVASHPLRSYAQGEAAETPPNPIVGATKEDPFVNSLGMKFVPVPVTGGSTGGTTIFFSVWDTRVQDYDTFLRETHRSHEKPRFDQRPTDPVVNVSWEDAVAFCGWLSKNENRSYRLPTDHEWSCAVGIAEQEIADQSPEEKSGKINGVYPWGTEWPPPPGAGNYADESLKHPPAIRGYNDGFAFTSPVGTYSANRYGLFDLGGNVWQLCEDWYSADLKLRVVRGASWTQGDKWFLRSSFRKGVPPNFRDDTCGFRCVLVPSER
jgi:hypothetical protein